MHQNNPSRPRRLLLTLGIVALVGFISFVLVMKYVARVARYRADPDLLTEIAEVTFLDDTSASTDRWTQWRGPNRAGVVVMADFLREWPPSGPPRSWRIPGGEGYSSFSVMDGFAYTMLSEDSDKESIVCLDLANGKEVWRYRYGITSLGDYPGPRATPSIDDNRLFSLGATGKLLCLDRQKGTVIWETDLVGDVKGLKPRWGYTFSPLVVGDQIFVMPGGTNTSVASLDKRTGKVNWTLQSDPAGYSSPVLATLNGSPQVLFFTGKRLLAVNPEDGHTLWEYSWPTDFAVNASTPLVIQAKKGEELLTYVFISSGYGKGCALLKITQQQGTFNAQLVYESNQLCCHFASPVRVKEHIYGLDETRDLTCLDLRTGKVAWRFDRPEEAEGLRNVGYLKGSLLVVNETLLVLGETGKLALVAAKPDAYQELAATRPFRDRCWTLPVLAEGKLLLRDRRNILCLNMRR